MMYLIICCFFAKNEWTEFNQIFKFWRISTTDFGGTKDHYIVSNEFEIWPDPTMDGGVSCP